MSQLYAESARWNQLNATVGGPVIMFCDSPNATGQAWVSLSPAFGTNLAALQRQSAISPRKTIAAKKKSSISAINLYKKCRKRDKGVTKRDILGDDGFGSSDELA